MKEDRGAAMSSTDPAEYRYDRFWSFFEKLD